MKLINYLKSWNWTAFLLIVFVSTIGSLGNTTIPDIPTSFLVGFIIGGVFGFPFAFFTRDKKSKSAALPDPLASQDKPDETGRKVMIYRYKGNGYMVRVMKFTNESKDAVYTWAKSIQGNVYHGWNEKNEPILKIPTTDKSLSFCQFGDYLIETYHLAYTRTRVTAISDKVLAEYYEFVRLA